MNLEKYLINNIVDLKSDVAFKKIFTKDKNLFYLAFIISYVTKLDYDYVKNNIRFVHPFTSSNNILARSGEGDIIVEVENYLINIEMSKFVNIESIRKNRWFFKTMISSDMPKNTLFRNYDKKYVQIILSGTSRIKDEYKFISVIEETEVISHKEDTGIDSIIYDVNLDFFEREMYKKDILTSEEKKFILLVETDKKILKEICKKEREMNDMLEDVNNLRYDKSFLFEYDHEAHQKAVMECHFEDLYKEKYEKDMEKLETEVQEKVNEKIEEKVNEQQLETAKKLLKNNIPVDIVANSVNLPLKTIKNLQKSL